MFMKKGQSALEFLTTYGWAFLVALIMIGALAYFGVLNPSKYLPERCNFGTQVSCNDYFVKEINNSAADAEVSLRLVNNFGETVMVTSAIVNTSTPNPPGCVLYNPVINASQSFTWRDGATADFMFDCGTMTDAGVVSGTKSKVGVELVYYAAKSSVEYSHTILGEIYAQVS
jgi:hypothetical protein